MDDADIAAELQAEFNEQALQRRIRPGTGVSLKRCEDCDERIPAKRQALGGVTRCTFCQEIIEKQARR